jgi:hypothetical protein
VPLGELQKQIPRVRKQKWFAALGMTGWWVITETESGSRIREPLRSTLSSMKNYCVGSMSCVNVSVLRARSIGVSGGNKLGVRKLVSKV